MCDCKKTNPVGPLSNPEKTILNTSERSYEPFDSDNPFGRIGTKREFDEDIRKKEQEKDIADARKKQRDKELEVKRQDTEQALRSSDYGQGARIGKLMPEDRLKTYYGDKPIGPSYNKLSPVAYKEDLLVRLADITYAAGYLEGILIFEGRDGFISALRDVIVAAQRKEKNSF